MNRSPYDRTITIKGETINVWEAMKKVVMVVVVLTIFLAGIPVAQASNSPSLQGIQIFPKDNIWNTRVDNLPVDANSDIYIDNLVKDAAPYSGIRHYILNGIPYNVVNSPTSRQYITGYCCNGAYFDTVPYPIPANPLLEQGSNDHHMEIIDVDDMVLYELSAASQISDGSWSARYGAVWDLNGYSFRKDNVTPMWAANEAGLPNLPGFVRYDEVSAGYINHSLRMSVPVLQNTWVWPARATAPLPSPYDPTHPPAGQRFRLKASYDISGFPPQAKVILQALKTYGAMASTLNGMGNPVTISGSPDSHWNPADLNTLWRVNISDFEAVDVSSLMIDKNSAQARQLPGGDPTPTATTPTPTPVPTPPPASTQTPTPDQMTSAPPMNEMVYEAVFIVGIGILGIFIIGIGILEIFIIGIGILGACCIVYYRKK